MSPLALPLVVVLIDTSPVPEPPLDLRAVSTYAALAYQNAEKAFLYGTELLPSASLPPPEVITRIAQEERRIFVVCPAGTPPSSRERSLAERLGECETYGQPVESNARQP